MNNPTEQMTPAQTYLAVNRDRIHIAIIKFDGKREYHYLASREMELSPGDIVAVERFAGMKPWGPYSVGTVVAVRGLSTEGVFTVFRYKWVVAKIEPSKDSQTMAVAVEKITNHRLASKLDAMTDAIPRHERDLAAPVTEIPTQFRATQMGIPIDAVTVDSNSNIKITDLLTALRSGLPFRRSSCPHNDGEPGAWMETVSRDGTRINGPLTEMQLRDDAVLVRYVDGYEARVKAVTVDELMARWHVWTGDGKPV